MTKIKKSELKNHLLQSVKILKPNLAYAEYAYFILTVLFFYHTGVAPTPTIRNIHTQHLIATSRGAAITISKKKTDSEDDLIDELESLEGDNRNLKNVLLPAIPAAKIPAPILSAFFSHLDQLQQNTNVFSSTEGFGEAFDYWISQLAKLTVKQGSSFYTPRSVIRLITGIVKPGEGMSIYDPTAGTGGMFIESANYIQQQGGDPQTLTFYGCESAPDIWAICKMNLLAHRLEHIFIEPQDALLASHPLFGKFDIVLQNVPIAGESANRRQVFERNEMFLRHALNATGADGRGAVLMPSTVLLEDHEEVWRQAVRNDWLEAVIALPAKLLHGTNAAAYILVINKQKPDLHADKVLFLRAVNTPLPYTRHNELDDKDIYAAVNAFDAWKSIPDYASVIPNKIIIENDYKLGVDRYLSMEMEDTGIDITAALKRYRTAVKEREFAVNRLMTTLKDYYQQSDEE